MPFISVILREDSVHEFKMFQKTMSNLLVQIVKSPSFDGRSQKKLDNNLGIQLGNDITIEFEYLKRIPREASGKLRYFASEINLH